MSTILFLGGSPASVAYAGTVNSGTTNTTSHSLSIATGTASDRRLVAIAIDYLCSVSAPTTLTAATIGGITASIGTPVSSSNSSGLYGIVFIWAMVPTGTSATVDLEFSTNCLVRLFSHGVYDLDTSTPIEQASNSATSGLTITAGIETRAGGVVLASLNAYTGGNVSMTAGVTQDYADGGWSGDVRIRGGSAAISTGEASRSITATRDTIPTTQSWAIAAISFR